MGVTPDRAPGPSIEEELQLEDRTPDGNPTVDGAIRHVSGDIVARVGGVVKSITAGGGSLPPATQVGEVLSTTNGTTFSVQLPLTSPYGWLINDEGISLVVG